MSNNIGTVSVLKPEEKVSVYLDVSGSMRNELNRLVDLLFHFKKYVNQPLWVFSDKIEKAFFRDNKLVFDTSYGTKIYPVFDHMRENNISTALIITDGYVGEISETMLKGLDRKKIQVIINADGLPNEFEKVGIQFTRLQPII
jgi:predicted metal-dependent peptidase